MTSQSPVRRRIHRLGLAAVAVASLALTACAGGSTTPSSTDDTLVVGLTATDIPNLDTVKSNDQGYEGLRFVGFQLYDGLTRWALDQGDSLPELVPALAESWEQGADGTSWVFHLRDDVTFHDGTPFNADAVVFALDRILVPSSPLYDPTLAAQAGVTLLGIASYEKTDDSTVVVHTNGPWPTLPEDLALVFIPSPTAVTEEGNDGFAEAPVGTGPFVFESLTRGQELVLTGNDDYWDGPPELDRLILRPIPDVAARTAALQSGEVDWIEAPNPDDIAGLTDAGFTISQNSYPHAWVWVLNTASGPLADVRVRQALNYAIDRQSIVDDLLQGTADPSWQSAPVASHAYDSANDVTSYDPDKARELLSDAGYADGLDITVQMPTGGSGNMQPVAMNEKLQSDLEEVGVHVTLQPVEWATLLGSYTSDPMAAGGIDAINISLTFINDLYWQLYFGSTSPVNVGHFSSPSVDEQLAKLSTTFDADDRTAVLSDLAAAVDRDAPWLVVVNDRNPRALAPNVTGFVAPQSWFVDLTTVSVG